MTLDDWLKVLSASDFRNEFLELPERKIHLFTAAVLRRVWDDLPSHHTRLAIEATEKYADRRVTAEQLARARSTDLLETCESLWLSPGSDGDEEQLIGQGCIDCPVCDARAAEYECRAAQRGYVLGGVEQALKEPAWIAVQALLRAREIVSWKATSETRDASEGEEARAQFAVYRELVGPKYTDPQWPHWRTSDVLALARGIYEDRAFDRLPILADALQDAGCDDENVLWHCRRPGGHAHGCWVVDLARGFA